MSTAIVNTTPAPVVPSGFDGYRREEIDLIKRTVAKDATDDELRLYEYDCRRNGVHMLDKLIYFTKRQGKYTPVTSVDFMRSRAESTGAYAGNDDPVFDSEDNPQKATVTVWKMVEGQRVAFTASARWKQYYPGDSLGFMWKKMPHLMLGKCAEALALRKAFPKQLAGLYAREEMDQAGATSSDDTPTIDTGIKRTAVKQLPQSVAPVEETMLPEQAPVTIPAVEGVSGNEPEWDALGAEKPATITEAQRKRLFKIAKDRGLTTDEIRSALQVQFGIEHTTDIAASRYEEVCAYFTKGK